MQNPLLFADYLIKGFEQGINSVQDSCLESLVYLIAKFGLEYEDYYPKLYSLVKSRSSFNLKLLKIVEISLRNSKLKESTILPFLKLLLRKCMLSTPLEIFWFLGIVLNVAKKNDSI